MSSQAMRPFLCSLNCMPEGGRIYYATTRSKARYLYLLDVSDVNDSIRFQDIRVRPVKALPYSVGFASNAKYRGIPEAHIGMRVEVDGEPGIIAGHNDSANLDVAFTDGKFRGQTLNCHPRWMMRYFREDGSVLYDFMGESRP